MTEQEELKILRELLWKIGTYAMSYKPDKITEIISEIRYGYCYSQSNSYEGQPFGDAEKSRIRSLKRLSKL